MSKITEKTATTDEAEIAYLEANDMMILPKEQRGKFLPDDDPKRLDGFRRPVCYWMHADQSIRRAFIMLPKGIKQHGELKDHPLCFYRLQTSGDLHKLRVLDEIVFISHDFSWIHEARVTHASERVTLRHYGTQTALDWTAPNVQPAKVAA
jgi:hypothetical protein